MISVRLTDVPLPIRLSAARQAIRAHIYQRVSADDLLEAALFPSDRVYHLPDTARPMVEELVVRRAA